MLELANLSTSPAFNHKVEIGPIPEPTLPAIKLLTIIMMLLYDITFSIFHTLPEGTVYAGELYVKLPLLVEIEPAFKFPPYVIT